MNVARDNRTLHFTDMPNYIYTGPDGATYESSCGGSMSVTLNYVGNSNAISGIALDHVIIPAIMKALRATGIPPPAIEPLPAPAHTPGRHWTLAEIKQANVAAGHFFFSKETMKHFGDTMKSFKVRHRGNRVFIERVLPKCDPETGRVLGAVGEVWEFDPATGHIAPPMADYPPEIKAHGTYATQNSRAPAVKPQ